MMVIEGLLAIKASNVSYNMAVVHTVMYLHFAVKASGYSCNQHVVANLEGVLNYIAKIPLFAYNI